MMTEAIEMMEQPYDGAEEERMEKSDGGASANEPMKRQRGGADAKVLMKQSNGEAKKGCDMTEQPAVGISPTVPKIPRH